MFENFKIGIKEVFLVGGLLVALVTAYNRVGDNTTAIASHEARIAVVEARSIRLDRDMVHQVERTDRLDGTLDKLNDTMLQISVLIGRLEAKLEEKKGS